MKRRMRVLIRKTCTIADYPGICRLDARAEPGDTMRRRPCEVLEACVASGSAMRTGLIKHERADSERGGGHMRRVSAAGADDQGRGFARAEGLRPHEDPVIGRTVGRKIDHRRRSGSGL